ncbi:hypothetical protein [Pseudomonas asplenii]|uniref:hypothetical protein n=1 Tax=Pseudomonas asplenii TaxID=53407 RepID=UPI00223421CA|nr:hypothetical protein [Pseudomonas asplenii]UZE30321.1 hypothetical protein LOY63_06175 [Pseudomonas asplenii]
MDFPKSVPSVGLVDGKFIDEDSTGGTPGSLIPSAWGNAVTLEILKVIEDGGLVPDEDDNAQLSAAIQNMVDERAVSFATKAEAEDGTLTDKAMSPLRVFQAIAKLITQATEGAFGWLKIGTQAQVNAGTNDAVAVTPKKLASAIQAQALTAFNTAGTASAFTLTPTPPLTQYVPYQRFQVGFHLPSGPAPTLNVSGRGEKNLMQYNSAGEKVAAVIAQWQLADVVFDSVDFVVLDPLPAATNNLVGIAGASKNLKVSTTGVSAVVSISADELVVESSGNAYATLRAVAVSASFATAGVGGLDVGAANSQTASTWYAVWVIWNGSTKAGLLSLSGTAPTLPAGYTHAARVSWVRTDATANKYPLNFTQFGRRAQYRVGTGTNVTALPVIAQAASAIPLWTAIGTGGVVPPTASAIDVGCLSQSASSQLAWCYVVPNNNYSTTVSATAPVAIGSGSYNTSLTATRTLMTLESANIYWGTLTSSGGSMGVYCAGWEDNL